jgi:cell volume regulation protein A
MGAGRESSHVRRAHGVRTGRRLLAETGSSGLHSGLPSRWIGRVHLTPLFFLSALVLVAYLFEVTAPRTRVPTVLLLLALGIGTRLLLDGVGVKIPDLAKALPMVGTFGLILIVFEGALELQLERDRASMIGRAFLVALLPLAAFVACLAWYLMRSTEADLHAALLNALPFAVISSAVAVPTARAFSRATSEFVVYESSFSDILGVLGFQLVLSTASFGVGTLVQFGGEMLAILALALVGSGLLALLLAKLRHRVKFVPILAFVVLLYSAAKAFHLPALLLVLVFGLALANYRKLRERIGRVLPAAEAVESEVHRFSELVTEATFVVRVTFFVLFGFLVDLESLADTHTLGIAAGIVGLALALRLLQLLAVRMPVLPLLFLAPRGLITVLLVLSIPAAERLALMTDGLTTQVVALSCLAMMAATLGSGSARSDAQKKSANTSTPTA